MKKSTSSDNFTSVIAVSSQSHGFSLVELLIAMLVGLVVLGAVYSVFTFQNKMLSTQEEIVAMQQNVRIGMDIMGREIGMAGYDPRQVNCGTCKNPGPTYVFYGATVDNSQLQIQADLVDGSGTINASSKENIIYAFDATNHQITRNTGTGAQSFIENVQSFTFEYLPKDGNTPTTNSAAVRRIRITITGRTAKPDSAYTSNGGYRTYTLTSVVTPRNLAY